MANNPETEPKVKLWYSPGACSLASHILLNESAVDFELIKIDRKTGFPANFDTINPKLRVPVLAINEEYITETPAIMTAISQLVPAIHLLGRTNLETVRVYEWLNWLSGTLHGQAWGGYLRSERYSDDPSMFPAIKAKAGKSIEECMNKIEHDLKGHHAVGTHFTVVDPFIFVFYRWTSFNLELDMQKRFPKTTNLIRDLLKRKSVQKALSTENIKSMVPEDEESSAPSML